MPARLKLAGRRFGRLKVLRFSHSDGSTHWICRCDCGATRIIKAQFLTTGGTKSCGCLYRDSRGAYLITHGMTGTPEYGAWKNARRRCEDPLDKRFKDYGGRGIRFCRRWRRFENFIADIGRKPSPRLTLDRIDNDGDYRPGNCRWATYSTQNYNRRKRAA